MNNKAFRINRAVYVDDRVKGRIGHQADKSVDPSIPANESIVLETTNDNTEALRFYQKHGFDITAFHRDEMDNARKMKPEIPLVGNDGIPLRHVFALELRVG